MLRTGHLLCQYSQPPGAQHDVVLHIRGKGLPYYEGTSRGNLKLRMQVEIPTHISNEERRLYKQLQELNKSSEKKKHWRKLFITVADNMKLDTAPVKRAASSVTPP